jgi:hypothetical protein
MSTSLGPYIYLAYLTRFIEIRNEQFNIFDGSSMIGVQRLSRIHAFTNIAFDKK